MANTKLILSMFVINMLLFMSNFDLSNDSIVYNFYTLEAKDLSFFDSSVQIKFGTDESKVEEGNIEDTFNGFKDVSNKNPTIAGITSYLSGTIQGLLLLGSFLVLLVTFGLAGITTTITQYNLPLAVTVLVILPAQILYLLELIKFIRR